MKKHLLLLLFCLWPALLNTHTHFCLHHRQCVHTHAPLLLVEGSRWLTAVCVCFSVFACLPQTAVQSGWHSSWTGPANWAGWCSRLCSASSSCSSTTAWPSHPTASTCCCCSRSGCGTARPSGTWRASCSSGCWPWSPPGAGWRATQVSKATGVCVCVPVCVWVLGFFLHVEVN